MIYKFLIFCPFLCFITLVQAQKSVVDSLQFRIDTTQIPERKAMALMDLGGFYYEKYTIEGYNQAAEYYTKALEISLKANNPDTLDQCYLSLGQVYDALGDDKLPKALEYYQKHVEWAIAVRDTDSLLGAYLTVASVQMRLKKYDDSKKTLSDLTQLTPKMNSLKINNRVLSAAAFFCSKMDDFSLCQRYFNAINLTKDTIKNGNYPFKKYYNLANFYVLGKQKKYPEALKAGELALKETTTNTDSMDICSILGTFAHGLGNDSAAYRYRNLEHQIYGQMMNIESLKDVKNSLLKSELMLKEEHVQLQKSYRNWLILGLSVLGIAFGVIVRLNFLNQKQNKKLKNQVSENTMLLQEVHHRVKNNLQLISSFMHLQQMKKDLTTDELVKQMQSKIGALSLVHQMLQSQQVQEKVMLKSYFEQLISQTIAMHADGKSEIECTINMDDTTLSLDSITSLAFLTMELLMNTIKYVLPQKLDCKINISAHSKSGILFFEYGDNGFGLPSNVNFNAPKTTGLRLVKRLAAQLNTPVKLINESNKLVYALEIPLNNEIL